MHSPNNNLTATRESLPSRYVIRRDSSASETSILYFPEIEHQRRLSGLSAPMLFASSKVIFLGGPIYMYNVAFKSLNASTRTKMAEWSLRKYSIFSEPFLLAYKTQGHG